MIYDAAGQAVDYRYLNVNRVFERQTGLEDVTGRLGSDVIPAGESHWIADYAAVAETGKPLRMERYHEETGRWYLAYASRVGDAGSRQVAIVFDDITERKRRDAGNALLAELAGLFSHLETSEEIMHAVGEKLGQFLKINHCLFAEVNAAENVAQVRYHWHAQGDPNMLGEFVLPEYVIGDVLHQARAGETVVIHDTQTDARVDAIRHAALNIHAFVTVPFHRGGQWRYFLTVNSPAARRWREDELDLIREVTHLTFLRIERARSEAALRRSEEKYRTMFDSIDEGFNIIELIDDEAGETVDYRFLEVNDAFEQQTGIKNATGKRGSELALNTEKYWIDAYRSVVQTGEPARIENYNADTRRWYSAYASRVGEPGQRQVAVIFNDITGRKLAEATLRQSEVRKDLLLYLSDALRAITDVDEIHAIVSHAAMDYFDVDRCYYCEMVNGDAVIRRDASRAGLPPVAGVYPLSSLPIFKAVMEAGRPFVVQDASASDMLDEPLRQLCLQLQIVSFIDVPVVKAGKTVGMLCITQGTPRAWTEAELELAEELAERAWAAMERARAEAALQVLNEQLEERVAERTEALRLSHTQLRELAMHMETTREDERTRIAREVHDDLGGHLTALKIEMGALAWGRESDDALKQRVNEMKTHLDEIVGIVRRIGSDLRPPVLDDYGLIPALEWHAREFERRTGISCQLDLVEDKPPLNREKRTAVFRAFQEALTNVARHAQASQVNVAMVIDEGELVLVIEDNGIGISQAMLASSRSLGLKGMEERLKEVGGRMEIEGRAGQGTVVEIRMPISPAGAPSSNG
jgi:signal transduction histidine kinase/PAS domain-containing protein